MTVLIKSKRKCWGPKIGNWSAGEVREVDSGLAELLLVNPNFSEVYKSQGDQEKGEELLGKKDDSLRRKKKRPRNRS